MTDTINRLVTIILLTFNQEKYVIESLESIRQQSYKNIELIVSDDCSTDSTYNHVKEWARRNRARFVNIDICQNNINLGISQNHSLAASKSHGDYLKYLGGDDILRNDAIERMVKFAEFNSYGWIMSRTSRFESSINASTPLLIHPYFLWVLNSGNRIQYLSMLCENFISAPSVFIKKSLLEDIGYFGNRYKTREDYHTWITLMKKGLCIRYLPEALVYWRRHSESVSFSIYKNNNSDWFNENLETIDKMIIPEIPWWALFVRLHVILVRKRNILVLSRGIKYSKWDRFLSIIDPFFWKKQIFIILSYLGILRKEIL